MLENVKIGIDIVDIPLFQQTLESSPRIINRLFTKQELNQSIRSLAGKFAAKEALLKATEGGPGFPFDKIEVRTTSSRPQFVFESIDPRFSSNSYFHLSISHHGDYAVAIVLNVSVEDNSFGL